MTTISCPAKINTFLAVGRPDVTGYHPIRTIFQAVSLFDTVEIESSQSTSVIFEGASVPDQNTITKTLELLSEFVEVPIVSIRLQKRIPSEAGLGGGSSDAAGILRWAKHVCPELSQGHLFEIAGKVGADVPFFLLGGRARAEGYGEILTPLPSAEVQHLLIIKPDVGCPTGEMYRKLDDLDYSWRHFPDEDMLYNDFERVAPCECLDLIERLRSVGASDAALSGSGSAVFGRFGSETEAKKAEERLLGESLGQLFRVRSL